jgi:hypothetical protein
MKQSKKLQTGSDFECADINNDGVITDSELAKHEKLLRIENEDKREDQIRAMAWFALGGMLLYPFAVVIATYFGLNKAAEILGDIAPTYFVSVSALVAAFFGAQAYVKANSE